MIDSKIPAWRRYLRFIRPNVQADIDEELGFHLTERIEELIAAGHTLDVARAQALDEFGDVTSVRAGLRQIDERVQSRSSRFESLAVVGREIRYSIRRLVRQPAFTVPAVVTLALGLASTAVVYSLLDAVVLRPLPYPNAEQLVSLSSPMPALKDRWGLARHQLFFYKQNARTIEDLALFRFNTVTVMGDGGVHAAERSAAAVVSASIFNVLGIRPLYGRLLTPEDNLSEPAAAVVLGFDYWMRRFGGDRAVLGRTMEIEGFPQQIVGILPAGANLPDQRVDLWVPDYIDPAMPARNNHVRGAIARLRAGLSAADAQRELAPLVRRMDEVFPEAYPNHWIERTGFTTAVVPLRDEVVGATVTRALWILFASVTILMLIAAANVTSLFIVRADARRREVALRAAIGARRGHLALHLMSEGVLVAFLAGALALVATVVSLRLFAVVATDQIPRLAEVHMSWRTAAVVAAAALTTGIAFGLIPLAQSQSDAAVLRESSRGLTLSRRRVAVRGALVVAQVALALVLLAGAGLMMRSFQKLRSTRLGFDPQSVTTLALSLPNAKYQNAQLASAFFKALSSRIGAVPGVQSVGFSALIPLTGKEGCTGVMTRQPSADGRREKCVSTSWASPGYFATIRNPVRGRAPDWTETENGLAGVVVTRALADVFWPGEDPIGRGVRCCTTGTEEYTVVGVADDVHDEGLDAPPMQAVYFPLVPKKGVPVEGVPTYMNLVVRAPTIGVPELSAIVQRLVSEIDPQVPIANPRSMDDVVGRSMAKRTFTLMLLAIAAAMALILSAVGLYGVISYVVGHRRGEIGIRMALGARASQVALMVVRQSMGLVSLGIVLGLAGAIATTRVLRALLFEVSPTDPVVLIVVSALLLLLAAVASFAPTRQAARTNPLEALRAD